MRIILLTFTIALKFSLIWCQKDEPIVNLEHMDQKKFQWGYYFGLNHMDYKFDYNKIDYNTSNLREIQVKRSYGFNVGVSSNLRLINYLDLRFEPGLVYNKRVAYFSGFSDKKDYIRSIKSTYIYFPLLLKFSSSRWYNFKPYITAGGSAVINLSGGEFVNTDNSERFFRMKNHSFFYELGFGLDLYTPYFRMSPSIRALFSVKNEAMYDRDPNSPWTSNIGSMRTQGFLINLTFE